MRIRKYLLRIHRWSGIALAVLLVITGISGSLLAFHHEIDALLNPQLHSATPQAKRASLDSIAKAIEARHPQLVVGYFLFAESPASSIHVVMNTREAAAEGRLDRESPRPTEIYADPYTGELLGERNWGEIGGTRAHLVPMIYRLHMSLFLDKTGQWITGIVAAIWIVGMLIGIFLALPRLGHLRKALTVKWQASRARVLFDLHRTIGLLSAVLLIVAAFTGLYMNLPQVMEPALAAVAPFTERPPALRPAGTRLDQVWQIGWEEAVQRARAVHAVDPIAGVGKIEARGYYQVRYMPPGDIMDSGTIRVFVDGRNGEILGKFDHRDGTVGDKIRIWQFPLHSGQGFGMPGRVLVCVIGLIPPLLAVTGLWLWLRRKRLRHSATQSRESRENPAPVGVE